MGITGSSEVIKPCEKVISYAKLAADHPGREPRPLKVAVDESTWRYNNISPGTVVKLHKGNPESHPVEKAMFWKSLTGPICLKKPGRLPQGDRHTKGRDLLKEMLRMFRIPYIEAPGEAEAECCQLQTLGLVDAVRSNDSDCLMFGCSLWVRDNRIEIDEKDGKRGRPLTRKDDVNFCVIRSDDVKRECGLDKAGCVLFAMLAGGDYDETGLKGCGAGHALRAAQSGLGINLYDAKDQDACDRWREDELRPFFAQQNSILSVPENFPRFTILQYYRNPSIHPKDIHSKNPQLASRYRRSIDE